MTAVNDFTLSCLTARRGSIVVSGNRQIFPKKFNARLGIVASTGMVALRTYTAGSAVLTGKGRVILMNFLQNLSSISMYLRFGKTISIPYIRTGNAYVCMR